MPTPEVKEDFPVCTRAGRLPRGQKGRGAPPDNKGGHAHTGLCGGIHLSKTLPVHVGEGSGISQVSRERQGNWPKVNKDNILTTYCEITQ